ncbi:protein-disulfide reductase DsbD family protein [Azospirillum halopraeferens]|uniref:protein-disulfide reductase DsbD family protein n=1 Tax=Azospirillum halopraeferens TaxID=34010 RepID=UPI00040A3966|nr:protein-disulfide reductase DsbD domain-containing protein [Azospirillum halopraeferens]
MKRLAVLLLSILILALPGTVLAAAGPWSKAGPVEARLIAAVEGTGDLTRIPLALEVRLEPGWKTYWRTPGDAGLPPRVAWDGSENLREAVLSYPAPLRFTTLGIETVGYDGEVVFPVTALPAEAGRPLDLRATVDLLVCADLCIPERVDVALALPAGPAAPGPEANAVARAEAGVPGDGRAPGLEIRAAGAAGTVLAVQVAGREVLVSPDLFVEMDPPVTFKAPRVTFADGDRLATLLLEASEPEPGLDLAGRAATLTVVDGVRAMEAAVTIAPGLPAGAGQGSAPAVPALLPMLAVALLGGLILNLMPCVLPVLSLKLVSVVQHGGAGRAPAVVRAGFLATAAGIVTSFLVLAAVMVGLKTAGAAVGWGIQFQQPLFLVFMVVLVTLFAANLWGLFEIPLPRFVADTLAGPEEGHGLAGPFVTGAFATLLATPCSAPFLGTAVGFALANGPAEIVAVFAALGVGLALPYLLVAAFPGVARLLPRPGRWMVALRRVMGAALALTGVWLLTVMAVQAGGAAAGLVAALMVALVLALWLGHRLADRVRWAGAALAGAVALVAFAVPVQFGQQADAAPVAGRADWAAFDESAIRTLVAQGRTVFVDVTADWCITCQANKKLVVERGAVARRLGPDGGVVAMRADWTKPDERIAAYLARHGRYGIPFNVVYGPGAPDGIALPELLSEGAVIDALDRAGATALAGGGAGG